MPNWCSNELRVTGEAKEIAKFKKLVKTKETALSLAKIFPEPDYTKVQVKPTFPGIDAQFGKTREFVEPSEAWCDWRIQNWGTKWDIEAYLHEDSGDTLLYSFDSAWSPPIGVLEKMSEKFPSLTFVLDYDEPGCGFKGTAEARNGEVNDECQEYTEEDFAEQEMD